MASGRFAPTPSGPLHVGNLRTALLAWLFARSAGSRFFIRIEDLDRERTSSHHERSQLHDLQALGIDWDQPVIRQSEQIEMYRDAVATLEAMQLTYPCWCSRREMREAATAPHGERPERCPGKCSELNAAGQNERQREVGRPPSIRFRSSGEQVAFTDALHGPQERIADDFILMRFDGTPAYNLATGIDDGQASIEQVVRGDDLLSTTARQIVVQSLLGLATPEYAHVPLVHGVDGERLAKRHCAVTLAERQAAGESTGETLAWMARSAGIDLDHEPTLARDLLNSFDARKLASEPGVLDVPQVG